MRVERRKLCKLACYAAISKEKPFAKKTAVENAGGSGRRKWPTKPQTSRESFGRTCLRPWGQEAPERPLRDPIRDQGPEWSDDPLEQAPQEQPKKGPNEKFMNFAHFCEFWCFSLEKKVHELAFLWLGLPG